MMKMIFYYDPILGLQYETVEPLAIDVASMPVKMSTEEVLKLYNTMGVLVVNSMNIEPLFEIISNILDKFGNYWFTKYPKY